MLLSDGGHLDEGDATASGFEVEQDPGDGGRGGLVARQHERGRLARPELDAAVHDAAARPDQLNLVAGCGRVRPRGTPDR